jgi:NitT/TauT family transport system substrate-binding protein
MNRFDLIRATAGIALAVTALPARAADASSYIAAATPIEGDCLPFLAQSEGYFRSNGVDVTIRAMNSGEAIAAAIVGGDVIIGSMNTASLSVAHQNGIDLKVIGGGAIYDRRSPATQLMVKNSSVITKAPQLNGKTVGVNVLRGSGHLAAQAWIDKNGGDSKSVHFAEMAYTVMQAALESGRIEAAVISEPSATRARETCRSLAAPHSAIAPVWMIGSYVASGSWIASHPDVARRVQKALRQTAQWYDGNRAGSVSAVAALTKQDPAVVAASTRAIFAQETTVPLLQPVIDVAARYGLLKKTFPAAELIAQI